MSTSRERSEPVTLLDIARRNDLPLPADTVEGLRSLYEFTDFKHFIDTWILTTNCLRTADDFRQVVVDYAAEAASHGAVYIEGIFSPVERVARGVRWETFSTGTPTVRSKPSNGTASRAVHARHLPRGPDRPVGGGRADVRAVRRPWRRGIRHRRLRARAPDRPLCEGVRHRARRWPRLVPHAGEAAGPDSIREALDSRPAPDPPRHPRR